MLVMKELKKEDKYAKIRLRLSNYAKNLGRVYNNAVFNIIILIISTYQEHHNTLENIGRYDVKLLSYYYITYINFRLKPLINYLSTIILLLKCATKQ